MITLICHVTLAERFATTCRVCGIIWICTATSMNARFAIENIYTYSIWWYAFFIDFKLHFYISVFNSIVLFFGFSFRLKYWAKLKNQMLTMLIILNYSIIWKPMLMARRPTARHQMSRLRVFRLQMAQCRRTRLNSSRTCATAQRNNKQPTATSRSYQIFALSVNFHCDSFYV